MKGKFFYIFIVLAILLYFADSKSESRFIKRGVLTIRAKIVSLVNSFVSSKKLNLPPEKKEEKSIRRSSNLTKSDKLIDEMQTKKEPANAVERLDNYLENK